MVLGPLRRKKDHFANRSRRLEIFLRNIRVRRFNLKPIG
jgi:hypothetical protein